MNLSSKKSNMMTIQIDGTGNVNKGAELMFYAIIEEIEKKFPDAKVILNSAVGQSIPYNTTNLNIIKRPVPKYVKYISGFLLRFNLKRNWISTKYPAKGIDLVLDASGFQFSDQWNLSESYLDTVEKYYKSLKENGTKIVLLSQAFGPFETSSGIRSVKIINEYVDVIIAREKKSYDYLSNLNVNKKKIFLFPDFTCSVSGFVLKKYDSLRDKVCIIPNIKMITHGNSNSEDYIKFMINMIEDIEAMGKTVFFLNHEGKYDLELCRTINKNFNNKYEVVTGLNAKEVKGVIGTSCLVVSSRFHGVASALSQGVPCLSTSWNHKYELLFKDYNQTDMVIKTSDDRSLIEKKIRNIFNSHSDIKEELLNNKIKVEKLVKNMWMKVWSII